MMIKKLLLFISFVLLWGCSQKAANTDMKVSFGAASADFPQGVFVIGYNRSNEIKFSRLLANNEITLELANGTWDFVSVGWTGAGNFEGSLKCGEVRGIVLSGSPTDVNISLTSAACATSSFGIAETFDPAAAAPVPFKIHSCAIFDRKQTFASPDEDLVDLCDSTPGTHKAYKVVWWESPQSRKPFDNKFNPFKSACIPAASGVVALAQQIPSMNGVFGMPVTIEAFKDTGCLTTPEELHFPKGILNPGLDSALTATRPDGTYLHTLITDNICVGDALADSAQYGNGLAFGTRSPGDIAIICNKDQLAAVGGDTGTIYAQYILGHDIDLTGAAPFSIGTYGTPFQGSFDGLGFKLQNYNPSSLTLTATTNPDAKGLFNFIQSASISNIKLENWDILDATFTSGATNPAYLGMLVGMIRGKAANTDNDTSIRNIQIDSNSQISFKSDSSSTQRISAGGLVGGIELSADTTFYEEVNISEISSSAEIIYNYTANATTLAGLYDITGGIIGNAAVTTTVGIPSRTTLEEVKMNGNVSGANIVGGLIGKSYSTEFRFNNKFNGTLTGSNSVGGLVGYATNTRIMNSTATATIIPVDNSAASIATSALGAIAGYLGGLSLINGTVGNLFIDTTLVAGEIGGIVGFSQSTTAGEYNYILNSRAEVNVTADGAYHGGIVGNMSEADLLATEANIQYSSAVGSMVGKTASSSNLKKGGLAGYLAANARMNIIDVDIEGAQYLGGIVGYLMGNLDEIHQFADVTINGAFSDFYASPGIGILAEASGTTISNIIIDGNLNIGVNNCDVTTYLCGMITGGMYNGGASWATAPALSNILVNGQTINTVTNNAHTITFLINNFGDSMAQVGISNNIENDPVSFIVSGPFVTVNSTPTLLFKNKWDNWGLSSKLLFGNTEVIYKTGSLADIATESFFITSVADWNAIGDDAFLMGKSFILTADLDFGNDVANFTPIGSSTSPFKGILMPNHKVIKNIVLEPVADFAGVFPAVGSDNRTKALIGVDDDPLKIENLQIDMAANAISNVGAIGQAINARVSIHVTGHIIGSSAGGTQIGGIVGVGQNLEMQNNSFIGFINAPGRMMIGGLVGSLTIGDPNDYNMIRASKVSTYQINGDSTIGGLVGSLTIPSVSGVFTIQDNYVDLHQDPSATAGIISAASSNAGGAFGVITNNNSTITSDISNNYVAFVDGVQGIVNAPTSDPFVVASAVTGSGTTSFNYNYALDPGSAATAIGTIDNETDIANVASTTAFSSSSSWRYDAVNNKLKLYWEP